MLYKLKNRWRDGTTHLVLEPDELMERLAVLVPPPRANLVRYHGILAPRAADRGEVVPVSRAVPPAGCAVEATIQQTDGDEPLRPPRRYPWADLMRRVFEIDVLECPECGDRLRILAAIHPPSATRPSWSASACRRDLHRSLPLDSPPPLTATDPPRPSA